MPVEPVRQRRQIAGRRPGRVRISRRAPGPRREPLLLEHPAVEPAAFPLRRLPRLPRRGHELPDLPRRDRDRGGAALRSEEHTSELQSRENLVCRLLLEKKKKTQNATLTT